MRLEPRLSIMGILYLPRHHICRFFGKLALFLHWIMGIVPSLEGTHRSFALQSVTSWSKPEACREYVVRTSPIAKPLNTAYTCPADVNLSTTSGVHSSHTFVDHFRARPDQRTYNFYLMFRPTGMPIASGATCRPLAASDSLHFELIGQCSQP